VSAVAANDNLADRQCAMGDRIQRRVFRERYDPRVPRIDRELRLAGTRPPAFGGRPIPGLRFAGQAQHIGCQDKGAFDFATEDMWSVGNIG
jgi:hypothetical protein